MAHGSNILHSIKLPNGTVYEIHDAQAVHTLADLAALGMNTEGIFSYQGIVATVADLANKAEVKGHVYHVTADGSEYVYTGEAWEEFGHHFLVEHTHAVTVTGTNGSSPNTSITAGPPYPLASCLYFSNTSPKPDFWIGLKRGLLEK